MVVFCAGKRSDQDRRLTPHWDVCFSSPEVFTVALSVSLDINFLWKRVTFPRLAGYGFAFAHSFFSKQIKLFTFILVDVA